MRLCLLHLPCADRKAGIERESITLQGTFRLGTVRAAWLTSPSLGWITIQDAGCADLGGGADACAIEFDERAQPAAAAAAANTTRSASSAAVV